MNMTQSNALSADVSIVYETHRLADRPVSKADLLSEKSALLELAARMHDAPDEILPKFVDLAMQLTGASSAGISLLEETASPPIFRWHYLRGLLCAFNGATTPRHFSPCGITLDQKGPVLVIQPERVYNWIPAGETLPEVLLVPLYIGREEPLGTLWIVTDNIGHFDSGHARLLTELATFVGMALRMVQTERKLHDALEQQETMAAEMSHRLKNVFAIVDGMIRITSKSTSGKQEFETMLSGRMHALAKAHSLVRRTLSDGPGVASDLHTLLRTIVEPHETIGEDGMGKFFYRGPQVDCGEQAVNALALIFHELATNAAKYGVLRQNNGRIEIEWRVDGENLYVRWTEKGEPADIVAPEKKGFGSTLVNNTVVRQFKGTLEYDWLADGLTVNISLPSARLLL